MHYLHGFLCKNAFLECVDKLLSTTGGKAFDTHGARHVLARTALYSDIIDDYGRLLGQLLTHSLDETEAFFIETDAHLLADFMQQIATGAVASSPLPGEPTDEADFPAVAFVAMDEHCDSARQGLEFIRVYMRTALQAEARAAHKLFTSSSSGTEPVKPTPLDNVITSLNHTSGAHPALLTMVANNLANPTDVLNYLADSFADKTNPLNNTAFCAFISALRPLVADGHWRPGNSEHNGQLWLAHSRLKKEHIYQGPTWEDKFIHAMVFGRPDLLHQGLEYIAKVSRLEYSTLDAFFPLPLGYCNRQAVLGQMAQLMLQQHVEPTTEKASAFLARLDAHHPDVLQLLQLHFSVCPTYEDASRNSEAMLDAFEAICSGTAVALVVEEIDAGVFE